MTLDVQAGLTPDADDHALARLVHRVVVMYYVEEKTQAEIARLTGHSVGKINRLIRLGRETGMVQISIHPPFPAVAELEHELMARHGLDDAIVVPTTSDNRDLNLAAVGRAAAAFLLSRIKDGDTICISGGKGVSALVEGLKADRPYDVTVVPATGLVQGRHYIDVNHVASELATRLGGRAYQIHAPMFADSLAQRDVLRQVSAVAEVLERARHAAVAVVGIGSVLTEGSSYLDFGLESTSEDERKAIQDAGAEGEILAHLTDREGALSSYPRNDLLVGLSPADLRAIPFAFGVTSGRNKVRPLRSILGGRYLKGLVTDERTAASVLQPSEPQI